MQLFDDGSGGSRTRVITPGTTSEKCRDTKVDTSEDFPTPSGGINSKEIFVSMKRRCDGNVRQIHGKNAPIRQKNLDTVTIQSSHRSSLTITDHEESQVIGRFLSPDPGGRAPPDVSHSHHGTMRLYMVLFGCLSFWFGVSALTGIAWSKRCASSNSGGQAVRRAMFGE